MADRVRQSGLPDTVRRIGVWPLGPGVRRDALFWAAHSRLGRCGGPRVWQCPAEWWGLWVDLRCLRAAVDRGGGSVSLVGLSWAMEPSELAPSWNRSSESSSTATGIVRLAIELGGRHQIGH